MMIAKTDAKGTAGRGLAALLVAFFFALPSIWAADSTVLWQIGEPDGKSAEFALGPDGYRKFQADSYFLVGLSDTRRDWSYVHPGPTDTWAGGGRRHTFAVEFNLREKPEAGNWALVVDLVDTHYASPPLLVFSVNEENLSSVQTPVGGGSDESVEGDPAKGKPYHFSVAIPVSKLRSGRNIIRISNEEGSWMVYDAVRFEAPAGTVLAEVESRTIIRECISRSVLMAKENRLYQPVEVAVFHAGDPADFTLNVEGAQPVVVELQPGSHTVQVDVPAVDSRGWRRVWLESGDGLCGESRIFLTPVRKWIVYLTHFTHLDIGYTHTQDHVERRQMEFLDKAQEYIRASAGNPPEARFRWHPEGLWAVESYLKAADAKKKQAFISQVKAGNIELCALYGNALTALYPEEQLFALLDYAQRLRRDYRVKIDSAMITDVPGLTWGIVPVLAQSGVKYISVSPNPGDRVGWTHAWYNRPFYWVSPSGQEKILLWMTPGYGWFHSGIDQELTKKLSDNRIFDHLENLEKANYPYDMVHLRYDIGSDNGPPDPKLPDIVREWNTRYAYPKLVISTVGETFREFERRYGDYLPTVSGDFTPYWEDGAASTAADNAANRHAAETLVQAEALWAMLHPKAYPESRFNEAWRNAVLYSEHTWGAYNSVSEPDSDFAKTQARIKQRFALDADAEARRLLEEALAARRAENKQVRAVEVFNTNSWPRTDLVILPADMDLIGDGVRAQDGSPVSSQRLSTGELAFLAEGLPPFASLRFTIEAGEPWKPTLSRVSAEGSTLTNGLLLAGIDEKTGAITELRAGGIDSNLVESGDLGLNDYIYVEGRNPKNQKRAGPARVRALDRGPLVATIEVVSDAPGARSLTRQVRLIDRINRLDITNVIDKLPVREKEGLHFGFPFHVPEAEVRMDTPWAVVRPEKDQMEGACKNFFTVQRWVDVSNPDYGVTLATVDAPLVQMGAIRMDFTSASGFPNSVLRHIQTSSNLYSYVMNNYWHTNFKADQEGPTTFRYSIRPHRGLYNQTEAARFGVERNQPLVAIPAWLDGPQPLRPILRIEPDGVVATSLKPSRDKKALLVRLFAVSGKPERVEMSWGRPMRVYLSDAAESRGKAVSGPIELPACGIVLLRAEPGSRLFGWIWPW